MTDDKNPRDRLFGDSLPGTRGDFLDDTEGHRLRPGSDARPDEGEGTAAHPHLGSTDEPDVEGHALHKSPSTEGEFARRGPRENPHGER
jgi:hypothetical protein